MKNLRQSLTLPFVWFPPDTMLFGEPTRSLSLLSHQATKVMGLRVLDPLATYEDPLDEAREVLAYAGLLTAPVDEISRALWDGGWRAKMNYKESSPAATLALLSEWRQMRECLVALLEATEIRVTPRTRKPGAPADDTPANVVYPLLLSAQIAAVAEVLGEPKERVAWHVPIWEAWQIYHVVLRREGMWTISAQGRSEPSETFDNFTVAALTPPPEEEKS
jgi:hypothetical protein